MQIFNTVSEIKSVIREAKQNNKTVGFVPTMGALHEGHFSLAQRAKSENDIVVCSIFVNPTQFNNKEDLVNYPKTIDKDTSALKAIGCDYVFIPEVKEMYPSEALLSFSFGSLEAVLEGAHRPGHFNGVGIVVSKLFNIVQPHRAYFGQKDLQQFAIINRLVIDLSFQIELVCCPTVREDDGLAKSSRNMRLTKEERNIAPLVHKTLQATKTALRNTKDVETALEEGAKEISANSNFEVEYLQIIDRFTMQPLSGQYDSEIPTAICIAAHLGSVRLIDNIVLE